MTEGTKGKATTDREGRPDDVAGVWYDLLDTRFVGHSDNGWQLRVYCVVPEGTRTWIQVALIGSPTYNVLLRMDRFADAADLMWTLEQWLAGRRTSTDRIIDVRGVPARAGERRLGERRAEWQPVPSRYPLRATM